MSEQAKAMHDSVHEVELSLNQVWEEVTQFRTELQRARSDFERVMSMVHSAQMQQDQDEVSLVFPETTQQDGAPLIMPEFWAEHRTRLCTETLEQQRKEMLASLADDTKRQCQAFLACMCERLDSCQMQLKEVSRLTESDKALRCRLDEFEKQLHSVSAAKEQESTRQKHHEAECNLARVATQKCIDSLDEQMFRVSSLVHNFVSTREHEFASSKNLGPLQTSLSQVCHFNARLGERRATEASSIEHGGLIGSSSGCLHL